MAPDLEQGSADQIIQAVLTELTSKRECNDMNQEALLKKEGAFE